MEELLLALAAAQATREEYAGLLKICRDVAISKPEIDDNMKIHILAGMTLQTNVAVQDMLIKRIGESIERLASRDTSMLN